MKMIGKEIRLERIMDRNTGRAVIIPMDHGFTMEAGQVIAGVRLIPAARGKSGLHRARMVANGDRG